MKTKPATSARGRPRAFDTEKALDRAMEVFWRKGYLGTSLSDLTAATGVERPSLYAAFGNKRALFDKVLERYSEGPSAYLHTALQEPNARAVATQLLRGVIELLTAPKAPGTCLWVHAAMSYGEDGMLRKEFAAQRAAGLRQLRARLERAIAEGDLPEGTDPGALARYLQTVNFGLTVQAATGASRRELLQIAERALKHWPV